MSMHLPTPRRREDGQAMVEFALGALALFAVIFALMTFGHTFGKQLDLKGATRSAARRAAVNAENVNATLGARQVLYDQLALTRDGDVTFSISPPPPWNHGDTIVVRTSTAHELNILGISAWSGTLRAESEIRVE
jgi:hypothetical protein